MNRLNAFNIARPSFRNLKWIWQCAVTSCRLKIPGALSIMFPLFRCFFGPLSHRCFPICLREPFCVVSTANRQPYIHHRSSFKKDQSYYLCFVYNLFCSAYFFLSGAVSDMERRDKVVCNPRYVFGSS